MHIESARSASSTASEHSLDWPAEPTEKAGPTRKDLAMSTSLDARLAPHASLAPLALRLGLGAVFVAHALAKAFLYTFAGTEQFFAANGFPGWTVYPVFLAELLGGAALLVGFRTRWVALGLIPVMIGALKPHLANGW